jgi:Spy/CpxP family protein refolding chaperone
MAAVRPQVRQELDATNAEIETVLTPEQKTKFANLRIRVGARRRDHNSPRP